MKYFINMNWLSSKRYVFYSKSILAHLIIDIVIARAIIHSKFDSTDIPQPKKDIDSPEKYMNLYGRIKKSSLYNI